MIHHLSTQYPNMFVFLTCNFSFTNQIRTFRCHTFHVFIQTSFSLQIPLLVKQQTTLYFPINKQLFKDQGRGEMLQRLEDLMDSQLNWTCSIYCMSCDSITYVLFLDMKFCTSIFVALFSFFLSINHICNKYLFYLVVME